MAIEKNYRELVVASLIWDLDKFYQYDVLDFIKRFEKLFQSYVDINVLRNIFTDQSSQNLEAEIIKAAKKISLSDSEEGLTKESQYMTSVFSKVFADEYNQNNMRTYNISRQDIDNSFPRKTSSGSIEHQIELFEEELEKMKNNLPETFSNFLIVFDSILEKYLWCIPASKYLENDISLYVHLKNTTAISICKYKVKMQQRENANENTYIIATGNFSGIQNYIFSFNNMGKSGVTKRLRAKSFYVDVIVKILAHYIIDEFEVTNINILMMTGGKFNILLPNVSNAEDKLLRIRKKFNQFIYDEFKGQLIVNLAWIIGGDNCLIEYNNSLSNLSKKLSQEKNRAFSDIVISKNSWIEEKFILYDSIQGKKYCPSCGVTLIDKRNNQCDKCQMYTEIGGDIPKSKYISYHKKGGNNIYTIFENYGVSLSAEDDFEGAYLIEQINSNDICSKHMKYPIVPKVMVNHIPMKEKEVVGFDELASSAVGKKKIAALKADIDLLGFIFAEGIRKNRNILSRTYTMSRLFNMFFSGYINKVLSENNKFDNVYCVFSGGDDLFLIGPWNIIPDLAILIQEQFRKFTAENTNITLSASITTYHVKEHITRIGEKGEEQLKIVKNYLNEKLYPGKNGRNAISFFDTIFSWDDFKEVIEIGKRLINLVDKKKIDINILRRISRYSEMYKKYIVEDNVELLILKPLFKYDKSKNYSDFRKNQEKDVELKWFLEYANKLDQDIEKEGKINKDLFFADVVIKYVIDYTKEGRADEKF